MDVRNPFRFRVSEDIESDATFLRLFSPEVMDVLPKSGLWDRIQFFQSAPGGGKTSLFRLFTPSVLKALHASRESDDRFKEVYGRAKSIGAVDDEGPLLLGAMISCARNYATLEDLRFSPARKERLLYALLNSRIVMVVLRGALTLRDLEYPEDLEALKIEVDTSGQSLSSRTPLPCTGKEFFRWAQEIEAKVFDTIDSFGIPDFGSLEGHDTLFAVELLTSGSIRHQGEPVATKTVVMLDDVHKLATRQRKELQDTLTVLRPPIGVWIAERLEALPPDELLSPGARNGRDYGEDPIVLEMFWSDSPSKFEGMVTDVANRRIKLTREVEVDSFETCLRASLDGVEWQETIEEAGNEVKSNVADYVASLRDSHRYKEWLNSVEQGDHSTPTERAIAWRSTEILIERDQNSSQKELDFGDPLSSEDLQKRDSSSVHSAAEFILSQEFDIPYYYGIRNLSRLASFNIDQFLSLSSDLFEELAAEDVISNQFVSMPPDTQEKILKDTAERKWSEIPKQVPQGRDVQRLLKSVAEYSKWETMRPTAPYAPGVTGFALQMVDRERLLKEEMIEKSSTHRRLVLALSSSLTNNLLEARLDLKQGSRGQRWMILYLNRWLCLHFDLPLQYGGWRPKKINKLREWLVKGYEYSKNGPSL